MAQPETFRLRFGDRREADVDALLDFVMRLSRERDFECEVRLFHDSLTFQQRKTYRMWLDEIAAQTGDDAQALHEDFLTRFAPRLVRKLGDKVVEIIRRTGGGETDMTLVQMAEYMDRIQQLVLPMGIKLTQPPPKPPRSRIPATRRDDVTKTPTHGTQT